jgi:hypothetical protein
MTSGSRPIESVLFELGGQIAWPEHPDQTAAIVGRLTSSARQERRLRWIPVTVALLLVVASILVLSPGAREAVADLLGVAGIEVRFGGDDPPPVGADLELGEAVSLEEAMAAVDYAVSVPELPGRPDAVYLSERPSEGRISMVWEGGGSLPAAGGSDLGLIYSQNEVFVKSVRPDNGVRVVEIAGIIGLWIDGAPHVITYEDAAGNTAEEETRLAGNVLMWERAGVTHRIETTLPLAEAVRLAESLVPAG